VEGVVLVIILEGSVIQYMYICDDIYTRQWKPLREDRLSGGWGTLAKEG
jgi:hypothetical protein